MGADNCDETEAVMPDPAPEGDRSNSALANSQLFE
jgi:hypothetical protein